MVALQESRSHSTILVKESSPYSARTPSTPLSSESMEIPANYRNTAWPSPTPSFSSEASSSSAAPQALEVHVSCRDEPPPRSPTTDTKLNFKRSPLFDSESSLGRLHCCLSPPPQPPPCPFAGGNPTFPDELTQSGSTRRLLLPDDGGCVAEFVGEDDDGRLGWTEVEELHERAEAPEAIGSRSPRLYLSAETALLPQLKFALEANGKNLQGKITVEEIEQAIVSSALMNKITLSRDEAEECAQLITEELAAAEPHGLERGISSNKSSPRADWSWRRPPPSSPGHGRPMSRFGLFFRTNWRQIWVVALWLAACFALFAWKFEQYRRRLAFEVMGYCLCTAKGAAETLKLNMALVLLPVCRNTMTWLQRSRRINSVLPFNDTINFHKMVAGGVVIGVILHGGVHLTCDFPRIANADRAVFRRTIAHCFGYRQPSYLQIVLTTEGGTGIAMVVLMLVAFLLATRRPRRRPSSLPRPMDRWAGFNAFWYAHHLLIAVYVLLVVHSVFLFLTDDFFQKTTWMYLAVPVLLYAGERLVRSIRSEIYGVQILKATVYPGKVVSLKLMKPAGFKFRSGMHIYVQCPQISRFEWHPFSLTSAPDDDYLGLHIRSLGDWSCHLYSIFQEALISGNPELPKIAIDGPYGAASQGHSKYKIILLVGLGIGATPFISILKDIANGLRRPPSEEITADGDDKRNGGIEKAYFYWVTREQGSFEWFKEIMKEIAAMNKKQGVIEMHNYLTSVFEEGDKRSALVRAVQALHFMKSGVDIISKTPVRTNFARPNWSRVFSRLASRHGGKRIGVFYCGPASLGRELQRLCNEMTIKTSTRFVFHKENY